VVLVGPDGAGKTTLALRLASLWPEPASYLYMGDNPRCGAALLPTTRALAAFRRWRGTLDNGPPPNEVPAPRPRRRLAGRAVHLFRALMVLTVQAVEEANQLLRLRHRLRRGLLVVVDRYFPIDYHADTSPAAEGGLVPRLHGMWLRWAFPEPDLVMCLDAPAAVLSARKPEGNANSLEKRRQEYLTLSAESARFQVVDVDRPLAEVERDVAERIAAVADLRLPAHLA
jgi:thymidylate kinase